MSLIDEKAVSDAVSINQKPQEMKASPPKTVETTAPDLSLPPIDAATTEAPAAAVSPPAKDPPPKAAAPPPKAVAPPTWSAPSVGGGGTDLPLPAILGGALAAFAAGTFAMRGREDVVTDSGAAPAAPASGSSSSDDVSIPYDAAARLAYDAWRSANNKGGFEAAKYVKFKTNYDSITSANMAAKKVARDTGSSPKLSELDASADQ